MGVFHSSLSPSLCPSSYHLCIIHLSRLYYLSVICLSPTYPEADLDCDPCFVWMRLPRAPHYSRSAWHGHTGSPLAAQMPGWQGAPPCPMCPFRTHMPLVSGWGHYTQAVVNIPVHDILGFWYFFPPMGSEIVASKGMFLIFA